MPTVFSTENFARDDQLDAFCRTIAQRIAHMDVRERSNGFDCTIVEHNVGAVQIFDIHSSPVHVRRSHACIAADQRFQYIIGLNVSGRSSVEQVGSRLDLGAGTLFLLDKALPYESTVYESSERILVSIRRSQLERRLRDPSRYLYSALPAATGICRIAADYLTLLTAEYDRLTPSYQAQTAEICLDLLAMAFGSSEAPYSTAQFPQRSSGALLLSRVKAFIHCHLTDSELSPTMIAERHNISKRYLQSIFARTGGTLCGWIKDERLSRAYAQLTDPRADYLSVTEIALRQGFNDIPHFTRQFKVKYGRSPTQVRHKPLVDA